MESIVGRGSPSKRSSTYGSSSKMVKPYSAARASSLWRFSSDSVQPAGFWKFGMMWASVGRAPSWSATSSASTSMPSASSGMARICAPSERSASSVRS
jgi:hypothetical protein